MMEIVNMLKDMLPEHILCVGTYRCMKGHSLFWNLLFLLRNRFLMPQNLHLYLSSFWGLIILSTSQGGWPQFCISAAVHRGFSLQSWDASWPLAMVLAHTWEPDEQNGLDYSCETPPRYTLELRFPRALPMGLETWEGRWWGESDSRRKVWALSNDAGDKRSLGPSDSFCR